MYQTTDQAVWSGRLDAEDGDLGYRWHQIIKIINLEKEPLPPLPKNHKGFVILGFRCDEGVRRNKGRPGASEGPAVIRKACAHLAWHYENTTVRLYDGGDIVCMEHNLEKAQDELRILIARIILKGYMPLILGGGHEVAYGSFLGIHHSYGNKNIGIINFDAHFDLRSYNHGGHSGSSFLQIADFCREKKLPFSYLVSGIQKKNNTRILYQNAQEHTVVFIEAKNVLETPVEEIKKIIREFINNQDFIYLTICMDVFDQSYAPGVSAPCAGGLTPQSVTPFLETVLSSEKMVLLDIAELNPVYDRDSQTARLAAHLIFTIIDNSVA